MNSRLLHRASRYTLFGVYVISVLAITLDLSYGAATYPDDVATSQLGHGIRFTDTNGMTLYQFENDLRKPGTSTCNDECAVKHPPLLAAEVPSQIPNNWSLVERDDGSQQWAFKEMPLYTSQMDSHKAADYGQGQGWIVAFETIKTPSELSISSTVLGYVLSSSGGLTLYANSGDGGSTSSTAFECDNKCLETWVPAKAPWAATNYGEFSVHARTDGIYQWAYQGKPLFLFSGDSGRGDLNGNDVDGVWRAMLIEPAPPVPEWVRVVGSDGGPLYADSHGMTLYTLYEDNNAREQTYMAGNQCDEACLDKYWTAVSAPSKVPPVGSWSVVERNSGVLQWAYMGRPLYTLDLETRPGQLYYTTFRQFQWMKPIMYSLPALQGVFF